VAALTAVALLVLGGAAAWAAVGEAPDSPLADPPTTTAAPQPTTRMTTPAPTTTYPDANGDTVALASTAAAHPDAARIQDVLQRHFDAVNNLDYDAWTATVARSRANDQSRDHWLRGYRTTHDGSITVSEIDTLGPQTAMVWLTFVSTQSPSDAPSDLPVDRICWSQQIPVSDVDGDPRLGVPPEGTTRMSAC